MQIEKGLGGLQDAVSPPFSGLSPEPFSILKHYIIRTNIMHLYFYRMSSITLVLPMDVEVAQVAKIREQEGG